MLHLVTRYMQNNRSGELIVQINRCTIYPHRDKGWNYRRYTKDKPIRHKEVAQVLLFFITCNVDSMLTQYSTLYVQYNLILNLVYNDYSLFLTSHTDISFWAFKLPNREKHRNFDKSVENWVITNLQWLIYKW